MSAIRFAFCIFLITLISTAGCSSHIFLITHTSTPLTGFHFSSLNTLDSNKAISEDYKDYVHKLSADPDTFVGGVLFFEDGTGRHAVQISQGVSGTWWIHDLIYDKDNKRIKTIKYKNGGYRS